MFSGVWCVWIWISATVPVRHDWEWFSSRTGVQGERHATTLLLFPNVMLVYKKHNTDACINANLHRSSTLWLSNLSMQVQRFNVTHRVECELQVECATTGVRVQGVCEQRGVCICNANIGSTNGGESQWQDIHLLIQHRDAPHTRWPQQLWHPWKRFIAEDTCVCKHRTVAWWWGVAITAVAMELKDLIICFEAKTFWLTSHWSKMDTQENVLEQKYRLCLESCTHSALLI